MSRGIYFSCGDSSITGLAEQCIDLVVTDPPFFDNVHYFELADFFFAWQQIDQQSTTETNSATPPRATTRHPSEVQDAYANQFAEKLEGVFRECHRVLRDDGLLVFSYHHSRHEGWSSLAKAILGAGFVVINSQPVKAEMSVATPKSQAKEPIQFDIILVCRKRESAALAASPSVSEALDSAHRKIQRLLADGFTLSRNDRRIVLFGQKVTTLRSADDIESLTLDTDDDELPILSEPVRRRRSPQKLLFKEA